MPEVTVEQQFPLHKSQVCFCSLQGTKQQYYTGYAEDGLVMTMKHMAKNVVKVNEKLTKYTVSITTQILCLMF